MNETIESNASIIAIFLVIIISIYAVGTLIALMLASDFRDDVVKNWGLRKETEIIVAFLFIFLWPLYLLFIGLIKTPDGVGYVIQFLYNGLYLDKLTEKRKRKNFTWQDEEYEVIE